MDRYLVIDITSDGFAFETAHLDLYLSPLGMLLITLGVIAYKVYKKRYARI